MYDSRPDTMRHIGIVRDLLATLATFLLKRGQDHDKSKLESPEVEVFDEMTPKLAGSTYGSDQYRGYLADMKVALDHHYAMNDHHPEHFTPPDDPKLERLESAYKEIETGPYFGTAITDACLCLADDIKSRRSPIQGMNLIQIAEMLCDWKAATLRHNDGDIRKSIEINQRRFGYSDELKQILLNTLPLIEPKDGRGGNFAERACGGDRVMVDSLEGFGGPATVIAIRSVQGSRCRVRMDDNNPPPFWAHDFEISKLEG